MTSRGHQAEQNGWETDAARLRSGSRGALRGAQSPEEHEEKIWVRHTSPSLGDARL